MFSQIIKSKEFIITSSGFITAAGVLYKQLQQPVKDFNDFALLIEVLNILVLIAGIIIFSRQYSFQLPDKNEHKIKMLIAQEVKENMGEHMRTDEKIEDKMRARVARVSKLVTQLLNTFKGFSVCLLLLYTFLFITDLNAKYETEERKAQLNHIEDTVKNFNRYIVDTIYYTKKDSLTMKDTLTKKDTLSFYTGKKAGFDSVKKETLRKQGDSIKNINEAIEKIYNKETSLASLITCTDPLQKVVFKEVLIALIDNLFNVLSTVFLFMGFYILFHQSVDVSKTEESFDSANGYWMPLLIAVIIIIAGSYIIVAGFYNQNLQSLMLWLRITGGIFNGVGMALIISRFISMEYLYKQSDDIARNFYLVGTIIILPVYVVIQPLWGIFQTNVQNREALKEILLMLCLWGKIFFIMIIYYMLDNRWLHTYIYMMPVAEERMKLITAIFDDGVVNIKKAKPDA